MCEWVLVLVRISVFFSLVVVLRFCVVSVLIGWVVDLFLLCIRFRLVLLSGVRIFFLFCFLMWYLWQLKKVKWFLVVQCRNFWVLVCEVVLIGSWWVFRLLVRVSVLVCMVFQLWMMVCILFSVLMMVCLILFMVLVGCWLIFSSIIDLVVLLLIVVSLLVLLWVKWIIGWFSICMLMLCLVSDIVIVLIRNGMLLLMICSMVCVDFQLLVFRVGLNMCMLVLFGLWMWVNFSVFVVSVVYFLVVWCGNLFVFMCLQKLVVKVIVLVCLVDGQCLCKVVYIGFSEKFIGEIVCVLVGLDLFFMVLVVGFCGFMVEWCVLFSWENEIVGLLYRNILLQDGIR